jgi:hypothetical protein
MLPGVALTLLAMAISLAAAAAAFWQAAEAWKSRRAAQTSAEESARSAVRAADAADRGADALARIAMSVEGPEVLFGAIETGPRKMASCSVRVTNAGRAVARNVQVMSDPPSTPRDLLPGESIDVSLRGHLPQTIAVRHGEPPQEVRVPVSRAARHA